MVNVCLYFQLNPIMNLNKLSIFDIGKNQNYFNDDIKKSENNIKATKELTNKVYKQANGMILRLLGDNLNFKVSYFVPGIVLEQFEKHSPEVIAQFKKLIATGKVEFLSAPYYSNLSYFYSKKEFVNQVRLNEKKLKELFNYKPRVFATELTLTNDLIKTIENLGYKAILTENTSYNQNLIYGLKNSKIKLLLKNNKLSDYIAHNFSNTSWKNWPLSAEKYTSWINKTDSRNQCINIYLDYEVLGLHHQKNSGIMRFFADLPSKVLQYQANDFKIPSELIKLYESKKHFKLNNLNYLKVAGNRLQLESLRKLYGMEKTITNVQDNNLLETWRKLQLKDNFGYMSRKAVNKNPYGGPYEAFINFANILEDFNLKLNKGSAVNTQKKPRKSLNITKEKLNKAQIKRIEVEKPEDIINKLKEVYNIG